MRFGIAISCCLAFGLICQPLPAHAYELSTVLLPSGKSILKKAISQIGKSFSNRRTKDLMGVGQGFKTKVLALKTPFGRGIQNRPLKLELGLDASPNFDSGLGLEHNTKISLSQELELLNKPIKVKLLVREKNEHFDSATIGFEISM